DAATRKEIVSPFDYTARFGYKVPAPHITARYGTFAREFDVDFSEYVQTTGTQVAAFTAATPIKKGTGDYGQSEYYVQMKSVDTYTHEPYTYVPQTIGGVLLKVLNGNRTTDDFFYTISEKEVVVGPLSDGSLMRGATYKDYITDSPNCYVMQDGQFRLLPTDTPTIIPVHKAFICLSDLPVGAKVDFGFTQEDGKTTGIESMNTIGETDNAPYYNLNGQRVEQPQHGVYIHKGRKVVIK
ncbi:MAG: leucine-rich repeat domain-containing protein, partial [Prevotellaceae bacterium]|nr:leucine-rich repeat domain-containing protein [Prevotellaceae bacterium]